MLREIKVSNFAIIDQVCVQFKNGFNVLSGETGSGKSVLLKSLALLMGEKSESGTIKSGEEQAVVEGLFDLTHRPDIQSRLKESGFDHSESTLVVKRIISQDGKNRVYVNGGLSTLQQLKEIVCPLIELSGFPAPLIEMTGQHDNRHLQNRAYHLDALDQYAGLLPLRSRVELLYFKKIETESQINKLTEESRVKNQRLDFLTFQRDEIKSLNLKEGDEERLESEIHGLRDATRLTDFFSLSESVLYSDDDSVLARMHKVLQKSLDFVRDNKIFAEKMQNLEQAKRLIEEYIFDLRDYNKNLNTDPQHLEQLEQQLSSLRKLQKKFGSQVTDILASYAQIEEEISRLTNADEHLENLKKTLTEISAAYAKEAKKLHQSRIGAAPLLSKSVNSELTDLNMKGLIFAIQIVELEAPTANGISSVEFTIQTSKSDMPRSLAKFASGGELSRILLSLKRVIGVSEWPRTYLFDEVDAGVSGVTAEKVGRKLKSIANNKKNTAKNQQVICVTHLPQVAAFADAHFVIQKSTSSRGALMSVSELDKKAQVQEIARMLSGEKITKSSLANAQELLKLQ